MPNAMVASVRSAALAVVLSGAVVAPSFAAVDTVKVENLMQAMGTDRMLQQMQAQYVDMMRQLARNTTGAQMSTAQQKILDRYIGLMSSLMFEGENRSRFRAMISEVYATQFTPREIDDMIRFYQSETGRSIVAKTPQVMQQSGQLAMTWLQALKPDIDKLIVQMQEELRGCKDGCSGAAAKKAS